MAAIMYSNKDITSFRHPWCKKRSLNGGIQYYCVPYEYARYVATIKLHTPTPSRQHKQAGRQKNL